jgi:hypothetical protein
MEPAAPHRDPTPVTRPDVLRYVRRVSALHIGDNTDGVREGVALYSLSDPREVRSVRYIGQTRSPARRYLQHVNTAQLWLPADMPWWIKTPQLRELYDWIRNLYREEGRLPFMLITEWAATPAEARQRERALIMEHLSRQIPLFNFEQEVQRRRGTLPLL